MRSGKLWVDDVPAPLLLEQGILVRNQASLVSAGTERMMLELGKKSLLGKARERPDLVRKVLDKVQRDGLWATLRTVRDKLDREIPLGYSACGEVIGVGARAGEFRAGQMAACAGAGYANHAEVNYVPRLLAVAVPEGVSAEAAAYSTVGTIALQGVRNADIRFGETALVLGLGLIGQLTVQILKAAGCRVVGLDVSDARVALAAEHGADLALKIEGERTEQRVMQFTRGRGADAVLITAATASNEPIEQAARLARDRARVVMVGVTGMNIPRTPYFKKELTLLVSRSYGPGRYDPQYEEHGQDYPIGYVRWTENRNIEAFLDLIAAGKIKPEVCTTHRFPITDAEKAFELILTNSEPYLGVILTYPQREGEAQASKIILKTAAPGKPKDKVGVSVVGAGGFARAAHLPNLAKLPGAVRRGVIDAQGINARSAATKFGFDFCASIEADALKDAETDLVILTTPHSRHCEGIVSTLAAGKHVMVEKPLSISVEQVRAVCEATSKHAGGVMVGFNRRFSPLALELKQSVGGRGPIAATYRCNAGPTPADHWISDPAEGGRIIGEACHFIDFFAFLTDARPMSVLAAAPSADSIHDAMATIAYEDGSVCQLIYTTAGAAAFSKERIEVFVGGLSAVLEDFRLLEVHGGKKLLRRKLATADKGFYQELEAVLAAIRQGQPMPIPFASLVDTTLVTLAIGESIRRGQAVPLDELRARVAPQ